MLIEQGDGDMPKEPQKSDTGPGQIKAVFQATEASIAAALPGGEEPSSGDWLASQDRFMSLANGIMQAGLHLFHAAATFGLWHPPHVSQAESCACHPAGSQICCRACNSTNASESHQHVPIWLTPTHPPLQ